MLRSPVQPQGGELAVAVGKGFVSAMVELAGIRQWRGCDEEDGWERQPRVGIRQAGRLSAAAARDPVCVEN